MNNDLEISLMGTLVPLNKIVRCRWRDEEDSPDKVKDAIKRIGEQGFRYNLQGMRLDTVEKLIEYLMVSDRELYPTRELAEIKAVTMPLDLIEQWVGHHRREGCHQLGTWYIWTLEHEGKRDLVPFILKDVSACMEEARTIYLSDNMKNDQQLAGWAIGNVRKMLPDLISSGMAKSEAHAYLAKEMGLQPRDIEKLAEISKGLIGGVVSPAIKRLTPDNATEFWRVLNQTLALTPVTLDLQKEIIDESFDSKNPRKSIGNAFSAIKASLPELQKVVVPKPPKAPETVALQLAWKLYQILQREDFEDDAKQRINEIVVSCGRLTTTTLSEEDIETDEIIAEVEAEEAAKAVTQETYDETTVH